MSHEDAQATFDVADPHSQATFRAEVPGLLVEDHSTLVYGVVADGRMPAEDRITIEAGRRSGTWSRAAIPPVSNRGCSHRWPEGKTTENRVHLDVHVEPDRKQVEVDRAHRPRCGVDRDARRPWPRWAAGSGAALGGEQYLGT